MSYRYWFDKIVDFLEARFGRFAIPNLTFYIVICNAVVYGLTMAQPAYGELLTFNLGKIMQGQVWRVFTYLFIPPDSDLIFIRLPLSYQLGRQTLLLTRVKKKGLQG